MAEANGLLERYSGERYGRVLAGVYLSAAIVWMVASVLGYPEAGFVGFIAIFTAGLVGDFLVRRSSVILYDERHEEISKRASESVFSVFGGGGFLLYVSLVTLEFAGVYEMGDRVEAVFLTWSAFVLTWGVFYAYHKYNA